MSDRDTAARRPLLPRQPLSLGDVIEGAVALLRATASTAGRVVVVVYAPLAVLNALALTTTGEVDPRDPFASLTSGDVTLLALSSIIGFVAAPLVGAVLTWLAVDRARGGSASWVDAYGAAAGVFRRVVLATLLILLLGLVAVIVVAIPAGLGAMAGPEVAVLTLLALGVPVLLILLSLSYLLVPAVVVEDAGPGAAVRRAWELLRVRLWPTLGVVVVAGLLAGLVSAAVGLVTTAVGSVAGPASFVVEAVGSTLSAMVTVPFLTYAALLVYVGAVVRLEGPDALPVPRDREGTGTG
ncbi:MAG: hypothetical protein KY457_08555 [Actinobacteria bacterium]|nr:hypothetical protein [Actinomycetota bacterium]